MDPRRLGDHIAGLADQEGNPAFPETSWAAVLWWIQPMWSGLAWTKISGTSASPTTATPATGGTTRRQLERNATSSQTASTRHGEEGEVVATECQRRGQRPEGQVAAFPGAQRPAEEQEGERSEEDQQGVAACLLRVPDQHRVDGDERGGDEAGAPARELPADQVGDRNGGRPEQRRERAQAPLRRRPNTFAQPQAST